MTMSINIDQREFDKFEQNKDGDTSLRVNNDVLHELVLALIELNSRLDFLASCQGTVSDLRVSAINSVAVTGPATSAQVVAALLTQTNSLALSSQDPFMVWMNIQNVEVV